MQFFYTFSLTPFKKALFTYHTTPSAPRTKATPKGVAFLCPSRFASLKRYERTLHLKSIFSYRHFRRIALQVHLYLYRWPWIPAYGFIGPYIKTIVVKFTPVGYPQYQPGWRRGYPNPLAATVAGISFARRMIIHVVLRIIIELLFMLAGIG